MHAEKFWQQLNEQNHPFFENDKTLWRLSVPYNTEVNLNEKSFIDWAGALHWIYSDKPAEEIQQQTAELGGTASIFKIQDNKTQERFMPLAAKIRQLQLNLKMKFDPYGILNYGRLYSDL